MEERSKEKKEGKRGKGNGGRERKRKISKKVFKMYLFSLR